MVRRPEVVEHADEDLVRAFGVERGREDRLGVGRGGDDEGGGGGRAGADGRGIRVLRARLLLGGRRRSR